MRPSAEPGRREEPREHQRAAGHLESALGADHLADVVGVALAEVGHGALADRVELLAEGLELLGGELGIVVVLIGISFSC